MFSFSIQYSYYSCLHVVTFTYLEQENCTSPLWQWKLNWMFGFSLTTVLAASLSFSLPIAYLAEHKLVQKIYVSLTLNSNLSLLVIPGFSLVGRMIDSPLIGELWISMPSSQILQGFDQLPLKGIKTRCRGVDAGAGCTLTPCGARAMPEGTAGCRGKEAAEIMGNTIKPARLCFW